MHGWVGMIGEKKVKPNAGLKFNWFAEKCKNIFIFFKDQCSLSGFLSKPVQKNGLSLHHERM